MTTTGIPSVPTMCWKGMDFVAYWASSRVPPVLLSAPAVWSTVHQLFVRLPHSAHLPTHVDDSRRDATTSGRICPLALGELAYDTPGSWGTELRAKRIDLGRDAGLCLREPICSVAGRETAQIFVFREVHDRWISLFQGQAPIGEAFTFGPGITNGIKNLTVAANQNAETAQRLTYQSTVNFISVNKQSYLRSGAQYALGS